MRKTPGSFAAVCAAVCFCAATAPAAISEADKAAARKTVEQKFGAEIRQVKGTADKDDDLKTAGILLKASADGSNPLAVRAELARTAMELSLAVGSSDSADLAQQALDGWSTLAGLNRLERAQWAVDIRQTQLSRAGRDRRKVLAPGLVEAMVELAEEYEAAGDLNSAAAQIVSALGAARTANLTETVEELTLTNMRIQRVRVVKRELAAAERELAAAVAGKNPPLVKKTHEKIGLLHLLRDGNPISAADHLAKAEHEWAAPTESLRQRAAGKKLSVENSFAAAEMLHKAALRAERGVKAPLLELLLDVCAELEAEVEADSTMAALVKAYGKHARSMLAALPNNPAELLRRALKKLAGTVAFNPDGSVKLSYAFTSSRDLKDWTIVRGSWTVAKAFLAVAKGGGDIYSNVRFRADRPLHVSYVAAGPGSIMAVLALNDNLQSPQANAHFCVGHQGGTVWYVGGLGGQRSLGKLPSRTQPYRVQILHDGSGKFSLIVNGTAVGNLQAAASLVNGGFRLGFFISQSREAAFGKLTIRGTPVTKDPVAKSDEGPRPPPAQPPRPRVRPRRGSAPRRVRG